MVKITTWFSHKFIEWAWCNNGLILVAHSLPSLSLPSPGECSFRLLSEVLSFFQFHFPVSTVCCCLVSLVKNKWCCSVKSCNLWKHCLVKPSKFIPFSDVHATLRLVCIAGSLGWGVFRKVKTRRQVGLVPLASSPSFALGSALVRPCLLMNNALRKTHQTAWLH